jgi:hypothetical protein
MTPFVQGDERPNRLDEAERPGALEEPICRAKRAGARERQSEPMAARFEPVGREHRRDREKAEERQTVHLGYKPLLE